MYKFWKLKDSKVNKLILIKDKCIYKGNPKENELNRLTTETHDVSFVDKFFSIPYSYITRIENQKKNKQIKIFYGNDSEDELIFSDLNVKNEVFNYMKIDISGFQYSKELPGVLKYAKAQFFALLFVTGIFIWALYLANQIENGVVYEIVGGRPGLSGIVLGIAGLGVLKVILGYLCLLSIIVFVLIKKLKSRTEFEILKRRT